MFFGFGLVFAGALLLIAGITGARLRDLALGTYGGRRPAQVTP